MKTYSKFMKFAVLLIPFVYIIFFFMTKENANQQDVIEELTSAQTVEEIEEDTDNVSAETVFEPEEEEDEEEMVEIVTEDEIIIVDEDGSKTSIPDYDITQSPQITLENLQEVGILGAKFGSKPEENVGRVDASQNYADTQELRQNMSQNELAKFADIVYPGLKWYKNTGDTFFRGETSGHISLLGFDSKDKLVAYSESIDVPDGRPYYDWLTNSLGRPNEETVNEDSTKYVWENTTYMINFVREELENSTKSVILFIINKRI